jgi:hypothetical protein
VVDVATVSTVVATVSVIIGVVFTVLEVRHISRTRRTDIIMRIYDRFGSKEMIDAVVKVGAAKYDSFDDYVNKYGTADLLQVALFFEGVGALLEQDLIDIRMVDSLFAPNFSSLWGATRPLIEGIRKSAGQQSMFSHFEYLYERLKAHRKESEGRRHYKSE